MSIELNADAQNVKEVSYSILAARRYMGHIVRGSTGMLIIWRVFRDKKGYVNVICSKSEDGFNCTYDIVK